MLTDEHILPESIGGNLVITAVCKDCNSSIGTEIDGKYINSLPVSLPRFAYDIHGKSGKKPSPLSTIGVTPDGLKVRLDNDLNPYVIPSVEEETTPDGSIYVKMIFDKTDEPRISQEVLKKVRRVLNAENPSMSVAEIEDKAKEIMNQASASSTSLATHPTLQYKFSMDLAVMRLEYIKIAYKIAFHLFGYEYVTHSETAKKLRDAIQQRQSKPMVRGRTPFLPDNLSPFFPDQHKHVILILNGAAYIRLFNMPGLIQFEEEQSRFMCSEEDAKVFIFNFTERTHVTERFVDRLYRMSPQPS